MKKGKRRVRPKSKPENPKFNKGGLEAQFFYTLSGPFLEIGIRLPDGSGSTTSTNKVEDFIEWIATTKYFADSLADHPEIRRRVFASMRRKKR